MTRRPRDPKWAALRQWHRKEMRVAFADFVESPLDADGSLSTARYRLHEAALAEMSRISRQHGRKETRG